MWTPDTEKQLHLVEKLHHVLILQKFAKACTPTPFFVIFNSIIDLRGLWILSTDKNFIIFRL